MYLLLSINKASANSYIIEFLNLNVMLLPFTVFCDVYCNFPFLNRDSLSQVKEVPFIP